MGTFFCVWVLSALTLLLVFLAGQVSKRRAERLYPNTPPPPSLFNPKNSAFQEWSAAYRKLEKWRGQHKDCVLKPQERIELERLSLEASGCRMIYYASTGQTSDRLVAHKKRR